MNDKENQISEASIKRIVDNFYDKIRQDTQLKPIFEQAIGTSTEAWQPHLEKMYAFWSATMLNSGHYRGNPMQKHKALPKFDTNLFDRWLVLFEETARSLHTEDIVEQYKAKSHLIARSLQLGLECEPAEIK